MRHVLGIVLVAMLLGGCVAYVGPYGGRPAAGGSVVIHSRWGWHGG